MAQMEEFAEEVPEILEECHVRGLVLPYFLVAIAANGSIMALRCTEQPNQGIDAQLIVRRLINEAMELPINIMIVDSVGEACRVIITPAGATFR
jgi:hypothetical protein